MAFIKAKGVYRLGVKQYPVPVKPQPEKYSFINYEHIQRGLDLIDLISKSFQK